MLHERTTNVAGAGNLGGFMQASGRDTTEQSGPRKQLL
jgi:hypothetical protein